MKLSNKTVALVGFAGLTLGFAKRSLADEFWTMNHAYKVIGQSLPRIDRLFEIHEEPWIRRKELTASVEYWEWLKQEHAFPVVMQAVHPEIPNSVRFPLEEVCWDLFGKFRLTSGEQVRFFTSSFSYMLAMALYEKVKRVEIYGIEMKTGTEYGYQYPGGAFMVGLAVGRGMEVVIRPESHLCRAKLYGYGTAPYASREVMERHWAFYNDEAERRRAVADEKRDAWNRESRIENQERRERVLAVAVDAHADYACALGARQMLETLLGESDYYSSRQKMEGWQGQYRAGFEKWKAEANYRRAVYNETIGNLTPNPSPQGGRGGEEDVLFAKWMEAWEIMHKYDGALQALEALLKECDLEVVTLGLVRRVVDMENRESRIENGEVA